MPLTPSYSDVARALAGRTNSLLIYAALAGALAVCAPTLGEDGLQQVRSRELELHYRAEGVAPENLIELWYTRDRGATWNRFAADEDRTSPLVFTAPAEGLYGLKLVTRARTEPEVPPAAFETPHRWVFVDFTPPLVQWDSVEPADDFARTRVLHLRWTAYDDNFAGRPVALAFSTSEGNWTIIDAALPNTGRYDWALPAEVSAPVTLKLTTTDLGGNIVERLHGPLLLDKWLGVTGAEVAATQPSAAPTNAAETAASAIASARQLDPLPPVATKPAAAGGIIHEEQLARELYRQGAVGLARGQTAVAAERFREALEIDPGMSPALLGLAKIYCDGKDYTRSLELYNRLLLHEPRNPAGLRGAALAYVGSKDYAHSRKVLQQLLAGNDRDAQAWLDLGDVLFMMGQQMQAREHWSRAAGVDPTAEAVIAKARKRLEVYAEPAVQSADASARSR